MGQDSKAKVIVGGYHGEQGLSLPGVLVLGKLFNGTAYSYMQYHVLTVKKYEQNYACNT